MLNCIFKSIRCTVSISAIALFGLFTTKLAHACATCGFNDNSNAYFLKMIAIMTALPVICVGSFVYYLSKRREPK